ncbi:TBC1 domain family member 2B isoform X1 [Lingula anatina]|uniref:TBC1 domain family member 2B isoform X1 n=1 Tax=Lingula anatina TaxID=7574 RepID=A0A1S3HB27_LINAN|nr:TBC1 domain family member 2B isoform X1 [Lingula anatina]|eukprot:XP_013383213.1 TBC1 domain family member 2B isoform X1 [Lingula anatina]
MTEKLVQSGRKRDGLLVDFDTSPSIGVGDTSTDVAYETGGKNLKKAAAAPAQRKGKGMDTRFMEDIKEVAPCFDDKLCGYLNKGSRGPGKGHKTRWFVYSEDACKLYYYRTPQDILPLGEIDVSAASFSMNADPQKPAVFQISTPHKTYDIGAQDKQTMLYWLQELQKKRREFSKKKTLQIHKSNRSQTSEAGEDQDVPAILSPVDIPVGKVGEHSYMGGDSNTGFTNWSIRNLKTEIMNSMASLKTRRLSNMQDSGTSPMHSPSTEQSAVAIGDEAAASQLKPPQQKMNKSASLKRMFAPRPTSKFWTNATDDVVCGEISEPKIVSQEVTCQKCKQLQQYVVHLKDEVQTVEEELVANRELVKLMQKQMVSLTKSEASREAVMIAKTDADMFNIIKEKDKQLVDLEYLLEATHEEKALTTDRMRSLVCEVQSLKDKITVCEEMIMAKDQVVMALTDQIYELEGQLQKNTKPPATNSSTNTTLQRMPHAQELDELKDKCAAFEIQNRFLNKEILELNQLRKDVNERENSWNAKCTELEAKYFQLESKFFILLNEMKGPRKDEDQSQELVNRLLEDAMESEVVERVERSYTASGNYHSDCDRFGFYKQPLSQVDEEDFLVSHAKLLQQKSDQLADKAKEEENHISKNVKWENFVVALEKSRDPRRASELKSLVRGGIPPQFREKVWRICIGFRISKLRDRLGCGYYQNLLSSKVKTSNNRANPAAKQIELDLLRTLPNNKHYESLNSDGIPKLRRVLLAYSRHNPCVGYCQGMNRLAAWAMLFLPEEEAFWCLVGIMDYIMPPDYFGKTMMAAQADQRVVKDLIAEKLPRINAHFEKNELDISLFTFNWFLTLFVDNVPPETTLRIWDSFLLEGNKVLFRFCLAFLKFKEEDILKQRDMISLNNYLRTLGEKIFDVGRLSQIAFTELNPFPMKFVKQRRAFHLPQVQLELEELDALRGEIREKKDQTDLMEFSSDDDL